MRVFITICTSDSYVPGVLALNRSLKAVESRYPLYLLTTSQLSDTSLTQIKGEGIEVLFDRPITPGAYVRHQNEINGSPNWNNTFFKLRIFGLTQFDKLIYLDSDMIVAANIDYLFDKPHMSAVAAGRGFNPTWRQLNSGLMVIEPDRQMMDDLLKLVTDEPDPGMLNGRASVTKTSSTGITAHGLRTSGCIFPRLITSSSPLSPSIFAAVCLIPLQISRSSISLAKSSLGPISRENTCMRWLEQYGTAVSRSSELFHCSRSCWDE
mgnify:CR=1 FL=1